MSWAAFHVLEVMSSPKYLQKRVGYLGAVQSFRPDTEVLMLATNLLKKVGSTFSNPWIQTKKSPGFDLYRCNNNVSPDHNASPHHYSVPRPLSSLGSSTPINAFPPWGTQKDDCNFIPAGIGISRNSEASMAQNKGTTDGRGRRS
jgi:hypothetical protein